MPDGITSALGSFGRTAAEAGRRLAGATQRAVSPELTRTASACQLIDALEVQLGDDIGQMIKTGQQERAKSVLEASKRLTEVQKALNCPLP